MTSRYSLSQTCIGFGFQLQELALFGLAEQTADLRPVDAGLRKSFGSHRIDLGTVQK